MFAFKCKTVRKSN